MKLVTLIFGAAILLTSTSEAQKLDGKVAYRLKNATRSLDRSEAALKKEDLRQAKIALRAAEREWKLINTDYKGRFNENHPEIVAMLISEGAAIDLKEANAITPLSRAGWRGNWQIFEMLKKAGARCQPVNVVGPELYKRCVATGQ